MTRLLNADPAQPENAQGTSEKRHGTRLGNGRPTDDVELRVAGVAIFRGWTEGKTDFVDAGSEHDRAGLKERDASCRLQVGADDGIEVDERQVDERGVAHA